MRKLSTLSLVIFLFTGVAYSSQDQPPSAQEIMKRMISVYASCKSYVDEGEVRTVFLERGGPRTNTKPFATAFVRPSDFRFEYKDRRRDDDDWSRYTIWKGAESVKVWWSIRPGVETSQDLSLALVAAAGVSSGASTTVPTLLMPELGIASGIKSLSELRLIGEEKVKGRTAYKIEGTDVQKQPVTLWIDSASLLIVKIHKEKVPYL